MENINWLKHASAFDFGEVSHYDNRTLKVIKNKGGEWEVRIANYNIDSFGTPVDMIALPVNLRAFYIDRIHFKTKEEALAAWELHCKFIQIQFTF